MASYFNAISFHYCPTRGFDDVGNAVRMKLFESLLFIISLYETLVFGGVKPPDSESFCHGLIIPPRVEKSRLLPIHLIASIPFGYTVIICLVKGIVEFFDGETPIQMIRGTFTI